MKTLIAIGFWLLVANFCLLQDPGELRLMVSNIDPLEGTLYIAVYDHADAYMHVEQAAFKKMVPVQHESEIVIFENIPDGEYAVAVFQDLNGNRELDTKGMNVPDEPFGFSNDARGKFGPPKFKNAKFDFRGKLEINIKMVSDAKE